REAGQSRLQLPGPLRAFFLARPAGEGAVQLLADGVLAARQAVHDERALAAQRPEEGADHLARVARGKGVLGGVQKSQTPHGSGVFQPWPSPTPHGGPTMTAGAAARSRFGISMIPRALYENRQARTCRSAPSSSTSTGAS